MEQPEFILRHGTSHTGGHFFCATCPSTGQSTGALRMGEVSANPRILIQRLGEIGVVVKRSFLTNEIERVAKEDPSFDVATALGWHRDQEFIWGRKVIRPSTLVGAAPVEVVLSDYDPGVIGKFRTKGTLEGWVTHVGRYLQGNSRGVFACALAFAGPLLGIVGTPPCGGFQFIGKSGKGKTALLMGAASIIACKHGSPTGGAESWRNTSGILERIGICHSDSCLFIDEAHQTHPDNFKETVFALAEGQEKGRLTNASPSKISRLVFLSTSNQTVPTIMAKGGDVADEALISRVLDIPYPNEQSDAFDTWHNFNSGNGIADHFKAAATQYYGAPYEHYLRRLVEDRAESEQKLKQFIADRMRAFRKKVENTTSADTSNYGRAVDRAGLSYAAIALAIKYEVLPWDRKEALNDIVSCLADGLALAAKFTGAQRADPETRVIEYLRKSRKRLHDLDYGYPGFAANNIDDVPGYAKTSGDGRYAYLTPARMISLVPAAKDRKALMRDLVGCGRSEPPTEGQTVQRKLFDRGSNKVQRVYSFSFAFFSAQED